MIGGEVRDEHPGDGLAVDGYFGVGVSTSVEDHLRIDVHKEAARLGEGTHPL